MLKSPQLSISNTEQSFGIMIRNIRRTFGIDRVSMNPEILEPEICMKMSKVLSKPHSCLIWPKESTEQTGFTLCKRHITNYY